MIITPSCLLYRHFYNEVKISLSQNRRHEKQTNCAVTWYHELPLQLAVGFVIRSNSKLVSEKATCPEDRVD